MSIAALLSLFSAASAQEPVASPALEVPAGFTAELLLAAPQVRRPSAVHALRDGSLLVAEDPMDMPGPADQPLDRILRLVFADDGSVAGRTVFAEGLYAVFGMSQVGDAVLVMNVPHLTRLADRDGDGVAEERTVLIDDLGPHAPGWPGRPGEGNDHVASGIRLGIDGWLYVAVGDKGIPRATGTDGSTLTLRGGGVIRLRPDGSRLEVVARGLGNVLDVAIDEAGELFTYDNTDDGLVGWTRVTHVVPGGEYGYPWLYHDHPERVLPAMADEGGGSPAGGLVMSAAWPAPFAGSLLFCERGDQTLRRFAVERDGATFRVTATDEFARAGSVPDFRPTDVCESADGRQLYVADRGHDARQAPEVTGRLWRIRRSDEPRRPAALDLPDRFTPGMERLLLSPVARVRLEGQRRALERQSTLSGVYFGMLRGGGEELGALPPAAGALWFFALREPYSTREAYLLSVAGASAPPPLRTHALRALGDLGLLRLEDVQSLDLADPNVRRAAWRALARSAADLSAEPRGRAAAALFDAIGREEDPWVRIPLESALHDLDAWSFVAGSMIDAPERIGRRHLGAVRGVADRFLVLGLRAVVRGHPDGEVRRAAGGLLGEIHRRPEPWDGVWWGTQPARSAPPAHTVAWEETGAIESLLTGWARMDPAAGAGAALRAPALEGIRRSRDPALGRALVHPLDAGIAAAGPERERLLETLAILAELRTDAPRMVQDALRFGADDEMRDAAIELALAVRSQGMAEVLLELASSDTVDVRARALAALAELGHPRATER